MKNYVSFFPFSAIPASARRIPAAPRRRACGASHSSKNTTFISRAGAGLGACGAHAASRRATMSCAARSGAFGSSSTIGLEAMSAGSSPTE